MREGCLDERVQRRRIAHVPGIRILREFPVIHPEAGIGISVDFDSCVAKPRNFAYVPPPIESPRETVELIQSVVPHRETFGEVIGGNPVSLCAGIFYPGQRGVADIARRASRNDKPLARALDHFPLPVCGIFRQQGGGLRIGPDLPRPRQDDLSGLQGTSVLSVHDCRAGFGSQLRGCSFKRQGAARRQTDPRECLRQTNPGQSRAEYQRASRPSEEPLPSPIFHLAPFACGLLLKKSRNRNRVDLSCHLYLQPTVLPANRDSEIR